MYEFSTKIAVILIVVLFIVGVGVSTLLYELSDELPSLDIKIHFKLIFELAVYLLALFLYTGHRFDAMLWIKGLIVILFFRVLLSVGNGLVFFLAFNQESQAFMSSYTDALMNYTPTFVFQVILSPCLAYPILVHSLSQVEEVSVPLPGTRGTKSTEESERQAKPPLPPPVEPEVSWEEPLPDIEREIFKEPTPEKKAPSKPSIDKEEMPFEEYVAREKAKLAGKSVTPPVKKPASTEPAEVPLPDLPDFSIPDTGETEEAVTELPEPPITPQQPELEAEPSLEPTPKAPEPETPEPEVPAEEEKEEEPQIEPSLIESLAPPPSLEPPSEEEPIEPMAPPEEESQVEESAPPSEEKPLAEEISAEIPTQPPAQPEPQVSEIEAEFEEPKPEVIPEEKPQIEELEVPLEEEPQVEEEPSAEVPPLEPEPEPAEKESDLDDLVSQLPDMEIPEPTKPPVPPTAEAKQPPVSEEEELSLPELPELPELPGEEELLKAEAPKEEPAKPVSEAAPAKEKKPPIKPPRPPSAEKLATKPTDRIIVSVRRIIDYNSDSESGSVMDKLLRRGSDYKLKIPARIILDQIESGEVVLTVDFIYNQVPIELVNFVSAEHGANLRELTLRLPMGDVMEQIAPELLEQSKQKEQEESKWAEDGEKLKEKVVFSEGEPKEGEADREKSQEEKDKEKVEEKIPKDDEKEEKKEAQENKDEEETVKEEKEEK